MSMFTKLKQFKDLRDQGKKMQDMLGQESVTTHAMGDKVALTMDGNLQLSALVIDPSVLTPDKKEKLESAIKDAHAEAIKKIQRIMATKMQESGFKLPGM